MKKHVQSADDPEDLLILVNDNDEIIGYEQKDICHEGNGILHRAFSIFIFNERGELLLQKRSSGKPLWPQYWSNSVCSHPRKGETYETASSRRLLEEIGMKSDLTHLFKFRYQATFGDVGSENEVCVVFAGLSSGPVKANPDEIEEWRFVEVSKLNDELKQRPEVFTPWFKMEWQRFSDLGLLPQLLDDWASPGSKRFKRDFPV